MSFVNTVALIFKPLALNIVKLIKFQAWLWKFTFPGVFSLFVHFHHFTYYYQLHE